MAKDSVGRKTLVYIGIALISLVIIYLRDPTVFTQAQFWGEDGLYWYGQAYNQGPLRALLEPYAGSLQVGMRLVGAFALLIPFKAVPLFFASAAVAVQILPVLLLFTKRFLGLTKSMKASVVLAAIYLLLPNSFEVHANLTNMNWHLALLAIMVVLMPGKTKAWQVFDYVVLIVAGLTGPFSIILSPIAWWLYMKKKLPKAYFITIAATAIAQGITYLLSASGSRFSQGLGADPLNFFAIIGSRISGALLFSMQTVSSYAFAYRYWFALLGVLTISFLVYAGVKAPLPIKLFIAFTWAVYFIALIKPQATETLPQWQGMLDGAGNRYFWLPMLSLATALVWAVIASPRVLKVIASVALACMAIIAVPRDFSYTPKPSKNFSESAVKYEQARPGETVCLEVNPSPDWQTCLTKR